MSSYPKTPLFVFLHTPVPQVQPSFYPFNQLTLIDGVRYVGEFVLLGYASYKCTKLIIEKPDWSRWSHADLCSCTFVVMRTFYPGQDMIPVVWTDLIKIAPAFWFTVYGLALPSILSASEWLRLKLMHDVEVNPGPVFNNIGLCTCDECLAEAQFDICLVRRCLRSVYDHEHCPASLYEFIAIRLRTAHGQRVALLQLCLGLIGQNVAQVGAIGSFINQFLPTIQVGLDDDTASVAESFISAMRDLPSDVRKNVDGIVPAAMGLDSLFKFLQDPTTMKVGCAIVCGILALLYAKYPCNSVVKVMCIIFAIVGVHYMASETITGLLMSTMGNVAQSWSDIIPLITDGLSLGLFSSKLSFDGLEAFTKSLKAADDSSRSIGTYVGKLKDWILSLVTFICDQFGIKCSLLYGKYDGLIKDAGAFAMACSERFFTNRYSLNDYKTAKNYSLKLAAAVVELKIAPETQLVRKLLQDGVKQMMDIMERLEVAGIGRGTRIEPVKFCLIGASGVGKSYVARLFEYLLVILILPEDQLDEYLRDKESFIFRKSTDKFWEGYTDRSAVSSHNDAFTVKESATNCFAGLMMDLDSPNECALPMAYEGGKGKTFYNSRIMSITSNAAWFSDKLLSEINNPSAFCRRFKDCAWIVTVKEEYRLKVTDSTQKSKVVGQDGPEFRCGIDKRLLDYSEGNTNLTHYWNFYPHDVSSGKLLSEKPMSFDEVFAILAARLVEKERSGRYTDAKTTDMIKEAIAKRKATLAAARDRDREDYRKKLFGEANKIKERNEAVVNTAQTLPWIGNPQVKPDTFTLRDKILATFSTIQEGEIDPVMQAIANVYTQSEWVEIFDHEPSDELVMKYVRLKLGQEIIGQSFTDFLWKHKLELYDQQIAAIMTWNPIQWAASFLPSWLNLDVAKKGLMWGAQFTVFYMIWQALFNSVDTKAVLNPNQVRLDDVGDVAQSLMTNQSDKMSAIRTMKNMYQINIPDQEGLEATPALCTVIFLGGHTAMTTNHTMVILRGLMEKHPNLKICFSSCASSASHAVPIFTLFLKNLKFFVENDYQDIVFFKIPNACSRFPNISHLFLSKDSDGMKWLLAGNSVEVAFCRSMSKLNVLEVTKGKLRPHHRYTVVQTKQAVEIKNGMSISLETVPGECGQPGLWTGSDRKWHNGSNVPNIIYIHNSTDGRNGCGSIVTQESVLAAMSHFDDFCAISDPIERLEKGSSIMAKCLGISDVAQTLKFSEIDPFENVDSPFEGHHLPMATVPGVKEPFTKSTLQPTDLINMFERTRKPSKLRPYTDPTGVHHDPMSEARAAYSSNGSACIDSAKLDIIAREYIANAMNNSDPVVDPPVIPTMDVIMGSTLIEGMDINTSCGFELRYYLKLAGASTKGKRGIMNEEFETRTDHPNFMKFMELVDIYEKEFLEKGDRLPSLFQDSLKSELRGNEKETTRMFCSGSLPKLLYDKKYFGSFAEWIKENRFRGTSNGIGCNPHSEEWQGVYELLTKNGLEGIFADFGKYDKKLLALLINCTKQFYTEFYGDHDPKANKIRDLLFEDMIESYHITWVKGVCYVYAWNHGNSSGNFLTAIINGVANEILTTYAAVDVLGGGINKLNASQVLYYAKLFRQNTSFIVYGDDQAYVSKLEAIKFPAMQSSITSLFHLDYTDDVKKSSSTDRKPVSEGSFIARGFNPIEIGGRMRVFGNLRIASILEAAQWYRGVPSVENLKLVVENSLLELSLHGEEVFNQYAPTFRKTCQEKLNYTPTFCDWRMALNHIACRSKEEQLLSFRHLSIEERSLGVFGLGLCPDL
nr:MAG: structural polyprotein [Crogonang virus 27]